jgi:transposase InsO family protein
VLAVADPNKSYVLHTDASDHAMGAILMQEDDDGHLHPVAYASKTFNDAQQNYDTTEREALAIIWALQHFNTYCEGHKYTLMTDHQALSYIRTNKNSSKRIHRWQVLLQAYEVDIYYKKGSSNHAADLLSRRMMEIDPTIRLNSLPKAKSGRKKRAKFNDEYEVERILDKRRGAKDSYEYLVQWRGYSAEDNTWEPAHNVANAAKAIADYEQRQKQQQSSVVTTDNVEAMQISSTESGAEVSSSSAANDETSSPSTPVDENASMSPDTSTSSTVGTQSIACVLCQHVCSNEAALHVHRFHEHSIQVPTDRLRQLPMTTNIDAFRLLQQSDSQFRVIFNTDLGQTDIESLSSHDRRMMLNNEFVVSESGLLYMIESSSARSRSRVHTQLRLCIPRTERQRLMYQYHDAAAHHGIIHVYNTLREKVWWPRMLSDIVNYVRKCNECQRSKSERNVYLPRPMSVPTGPWTHVAIDHIGPFPTTNNGNKYILVIVDRFTKYAEAVPCEDDAAHTTARILVDHIICRHGFPTVLLSDRGPGFTSSLMQCVMKQLNIKKIKTTAYHPQSNGGVEIVNKTVKKTLKLWVNEHHNDWDVLLPYALFSYNTAVHTVSHHSPYYLTYGREPRTVVDQLTEDDLLNNNNTHVYAHELASKLNKVHRRVREIYEQINTDRSEAIENEKTVKYSPGDQVWLYDPATPRQRSKKLVKRWRGPYTVTRCNSDVTVTIMKGDNESLVSVARLRPHHVGVDSIEDQHKHDIELAEEEIRVINETIKLMQERKDALCIEQSISEAGQQLEREDEVVGVMVNNLSFIRLW